MGEALQLRAENLNLKEQVITLTHTKTGRTREIELHPAVVDILLVLIGVAGCSSSAATVPWQKATAAVPEPVLEQVIQEHTDLDIAQAKKNRLAWTVDGRAVKLTLFNFNTPKLCGALGCFYVGYWLRENQPAVEVLQNYLNPNLPANKPLFQVGENRGQALPCLEVLQMEGDRLRQLNYCFNGDRYQLADSQLFTS